MVKLFIVGFPKDMDEVEMVELFSTYGAVANVTIVTDKVTLASKGYGFISMADQLGAERAITAMNGATIDNRTITVRFAEDKQAPPVILSPLPRKKRPRR